MEANFWHQRWEQGDIAFHQNQANPLLEAHFEKLNLKRGERVLLPLCGKTLDIAWLLGHGFRVVGVELSELAIGELFKELGLEPEIATVGKLVHYSAENIDIFVGDVFDISTEHLGAVNAIYDRAALVALPAETRRRYTEHLMHLTDGVPQLLIVYEYDQSQMDGPPFSVNEDELKQLFSTSYTLKAVEHKSVDGGLKGRVAAMETIWLLQ